MIDISVPLDANVGTKIIEKKLKYEALRVEVSRAWQCKDVVVVPVVIRALGAVTTECEEEIQKLIKVKMQELQREVLLGTTNILDTVLAL